MNSKAVKLSNKVSDELATIADAAHELHQGIEAEDEDMINTSLDMFPTPKQMAATFAKLGDLLQERPWEKRSKRDA